MQPNIILNMGSEVFPWWNDGNDYVRGVAYIGEELVSRPLLLDCLRKIVVNGSFAELTNIDGFYCGIITIGDKVYLISDKLRSFPLFFSFNQARAIIAENLTEFTSNSSINLKMLDDFDGELSSFPLYETILGNVFQTQAHSVIEISQNDFTSIAYHPVSSYSENTHPSTEDDFWRANEKAIIKMQKYTRDRQLVVPLSGGGDSRIILQALLKLGFKKIITYTYGRKSSPEVHIAWKLSSEFHVKWIYIEYNNRKWRELVEAGILKDFCLADRQGGGVPHVQDLLAVHELKRNHLIDDDAIFLPGHGGGVVDGGDLPLSRFRDDYEYSGDYIGRVLFSRVFRSIPESRYGEFIGKGYIGGCSDQPNRASALNHYFEKYITDRPSKYIGNSVRVFEFFGYEWYLPLWDNDLIKYWSTVPFEDREKKKFMLNCLYTEVPTDHNVSAARRLVHKLPPFNPFRSLLRQLKAIKYYYASSNAIEGCFPLKKYLYTVYKQHGSFSIVHMVLQYYEDLLEGLCKYRRRKGNSPIGQRSDA